MRITPCVISRDNILGVAGWKMVATPQKQMLNKFWIIFQDLRSTLFSISKKKIYSTLVTIPSDATALLYSRYYTLKRVTSGRAHLRGLTPEQHSSEERSQRWRAVGNTLFHLIGPGIEAKTSRTDRHVVNS